VLVMKALEPAVCGVGWLLPLWRSEPWPIVACVHGRCVPCASARPWFVQAGHLGVGASCCGEAGALETPMLVGGCQAVHAECRACLQWRRRLHALRSFEWSHVCSSFEGSSDQNQQQLLRLLVGLPMCACQLTCDCACVCSKCAARLTGAIRTGVGRRSVAVTLLGELRRKGHGCKTYTSTCLCVRRPAALATTRTDSPAALRQVGGRCSVKGWRHAHDGSW
jgi:hypothetical protein